MNPLAVWIRAAKTPAVACLASVAAVAAGASHSLERYAVIIERRPFGAFAVAPDAVADAAGPTNAPPPEARDLRLCAITEAGQDLRVGLVDTRAAKSYYLRPGEVQNGIELVVADFDAEGALLRKDGREFWLYMERGTGGGGRSGIGLPDGSAAKALRAPYAPGRDAAATLRESYVERLKRRREELAARARETEPPVPASGTNSRASESDVIKRLREYQMELIRQGKTPLPIPLTPEMDAQLVSEGVLPPAR